MDTTAVTEKTHAKLGPSGAHRWTRCPGSVVLEATMPNKSSPYARWGTAAHEVAALVLEPFAGAPLPQKAIDLIYNSAAEAYVGRVFTVEGHDIEVDMEMADCVNEFVRQVANYIEPGDILLVEQSVPLEHITGEKDATGTSDVVILKLARKEIAVIDLKGGAGVPVSAENNEQCTMYADGSLFEHDMVYGPFEYVTNVIVQPRRDSVSEERLTIAEHEERIVAIRNAAISCAAAADPLHVGEINSAEWNTEYLNPGEKQCKFCNAKAICPALRGEAIASIRKTAPAEADDFDDLTLPKQVAKVADKDHMATLDADQLGEAMRAAPLIELWIGAVRGEVERRLFDGSEVPGYKLVEGKRGNRAWTDEEQAVQMLKGKARLKTDEMYTKKVISPSVAEKLLKDKPKVWQHIAPLIGQSEGKPSVAPESDKRPRLVIGAQADDFPDMTDAEVDPLS